MKKVVLGCFLLLLLCASQMASIIPAFASDGDLPDLWIENVVFVTGNGGPTTVSVIIWNKGVSSVNTSFYVAVSLYRPADGASAYFTALCSGSDLPLLPGYRWWPIVGEINAFGYIIIDAKVDTYNNVDESDESNNEIHGYIDFGGQPPYPPLVAGGQPPQPPPTPVNPRAGTVWVSDTLVEFNEHYTISITIENPDQYYSKSVAITITETPMDERAYDYKDTLYGSQTSPTYIIPPGGSKTYSFTFSHYWRWLWPLEQTPEEFKWTIRICSVILNQIPGVSAGDALNLFLGSGATSLKFIEGAMPSNTYTYAFTSNIHIDDLDNKVVTVEVGIPQWKADYAQKALGQMLLSTVFSILSKFFICQANPVSIAVGISLFALSCALTVSADMNWRVAFGNPDMNYTDIPTPTVIVPHELETLPNITSAKEAALIAANFSAYSIAASVARARAEGAMLDNKPEWASRQLEAASNYEATAATCLHMLRRQLNSTLSEFEALKVQITPETLETVRSSLANGFTTEELAILDAYNVTETLRSSIQELMINIPDEYPLDYKNIASIPINFTNLYENDYLMFLNQKMQIDTAFLGYPILPVPEQDLIQLESLKSEIQIGLEKGFYNKTIEALINLLESKAQEIMAITNNPILLEYIQFAIEARETLLALPWPPLDELSILKLTIKGLPNFVFRQPKISANLKRALINKIGDVIAKINAGNYTDAINKLKFDIRAHMDGDSTAEDWIIEPLTQHRFIAMIDNIIKNIPIFYCDNPFDHNSP